MATATTTTTVSRLYGQSWVKAGRLPAAGRRFQFFRSLVYMSSLSYKLCPSGKSPNSRGRCVIDSAKKRCPSGKEFNTKTRKCRRSCGSGEVRSSGPRERCIQACKSYQRRVKTGKRFRCRTVYSRSSRKSPESEVFDSPNPTSFGSK